MAPTEPPLFFTETLSQYLPLAPSSLHTARSHLCAERFSPLLLSYYPPLRGIILSYSNIRLSSSKPSRRGQPSSSEPLLAKAADEYNASFVWVTVDFLVYRLKRGSWREGRVVVMTESGVTVRHLNAFTVYVPRERIPEGWRWVEGGEGMEVAEDRANSDDDAPGIYVDGIRLDVDEGDGGGEEKREGAGKRDRSQGYYLDERGRHVDEGVVRFCIMDFDMRARGKNSKGFVRIDGSLVPEGGEEVQERGAEVEEVQETGARTAENGVVGREGVLAGEGKKKRKKEKSDKGDKSEKRDKKKKKKDKSKESSKQTAIGVY